MLLIHPLPTNFLPKPGASGWDRLDGANRGRIHKLGGKSRQRRPTPVWGLVLVGLAGALLASGCARRQMQINSFPEGAAVSVDHQPVGYTPVAVPFQYNGTREILLEKDGFKSVRIKQPLQGPWYFYPPFSLVTDNFAGREVRDTQRFNFQLEPSGQVNDQQLTDRAENLRGQVLQGSITPSMQRDQYIWETR
jgi:hypothetical protein